MYVPQHFEEDDVQVLHRLIDMHPLGALVMQTSDGLAANHIPFVLCADPSPQGSLHGHIARANPLWRRASQETQALVIFQGPAAFISPSWYPSKSETGKVVPTWNYAVVHVHGTLRFVDDSTWLRANVEALTNRHEAAQAAPWKVSDAPADFIDKLLGAIVGIDISITSLVGKWKLSQNRPSADRQGVVDGLMREGTEAARAMADWVRQSRT